MNEADWVIIAVLTLSTLISVMRGFIKEALSLLIWVGAFIIARTFGFHLAELLRDSIEVEGVRYAAAFAILFIASLVAGSLLMWFIGTLVKMSGLSSTDRLLGTVFGLVRGGLVILVALILLKNTPLAQSSWWVESAMIPQFLLLEDWSYQVFRQLAGYF